MSHRARRRTLNVVLGFLLTAAVLSWSCERPPASRRPDEEPRVVALSPGIAETLASLGLEGTLVGRHAFDDFSPRDIPAVGDQAGIDYEALLRLRPTTVLLEQSASGAPPRLLEFASTRAFEVHEVPMLAVRDIRGAMLALPSLVHRPDAVAAARTLVAQLDAALLPPPGFAERAGRMLILYWTDPIGVAGPGSYHAEIVEALGGALAIDRGAAYHQLDAEDVRRLDPDSILLVIPGAEPDRVEALLGPLASLRLRAVREGRVGLVNHPRAQTPGPSAIDVAERVREIVLAWAPVARN